VVPGYLVPLLLLKPWSVVAIVIEGAVTYFLVWLFSESPGHRNRWSSLFGRDRFFALIVISVVVRLVFDGLVFPGIGDWLNRHYHLNFDYVNNLHSFGLIVIALITCSMSTKTWPVLSWQAPRPILLLSVLRSSPRA